MGDLGLIPGSERSPGEMATHSKILAWKTPWTEESGRLDSATKQQHLFYLPPKAHELHLDNGCNPFSPTHLNNLKPFHAPVFLLMMWSL